jgi:hypothetical protein
MLFQIRIRTTYVFPVVEALLWLFAAGIVHAQYDCNVCQNSPYGSRTLTNPDHVFAMENGISWRCGDLQTMVQDVYPSANAQEARHCLDYQASGILNRFVCDSIGGLPSRCCWLLVFALTKLLLSG